MRFCKRGLYLNKGRLVVDGTIQEAIDAYKGPDSKPHEVDNDDD
jgi:ABC-type polysaccharide/polyol phosphate transport system ATPase subunit